jgi:hypothetical protein
MSAPPPPPPPERSARRGCCIAAVVLLVLAMAGCAGGCALLFFNVGPLMAWAVSQQRAAIEPMLAPEVSEEAKDELWRELSAYADTLRGLDMTKLQQPGTAESVMAPFQYVQQAMSDRSITAEEVQRIIELCRQARGESPAASGPSGS